MPIMLHHSQTLAAMNPQERATGILYTKPTAARPPICFKLVGIVLVPGSLHHPVLYKWQRKLHVRGDKSNQSDSELVILRAMISKTGKHLRDKLANSRGPTNNVTN
jgi:hypothetical protein